MIYFSADAAGIYNVATREAARRRGLAGQITRACIDAARAGGQERVSLLASERGEPLYRSLGFRSVEHYQVFRRR